MRCSNLFQDCSIAWMFGFALFKSNTAFAFTQCYYPDGSIPTDYVWEPCTGSQYSSCCIPSEGDICQPNGLCYYPPEDALYRGTCTDRTWNDPSCDSNICVSGFETTWTWVIECDASGGPFWACGEINEDMPQPATCPGSAKTQAVSIQTTTTTSSAGRYTSPPPIDTSLYSVYTDSYTVIITANAQSTTLTSMFQSTLTSTLSQSMSSGSSPTSVAASSGNASSRRTKRVVLGMGVIVAIIVGPTLALLIGVGIFLLMKRRSRNKAAVRLNSSPHPPPNGPVGADQVNPYEMDVYEATNVQRKKYEYSSPMVDAYEVGGDQSGFKDEKVWGRPGAMEIDGDEVRSPRTPAPTYSEALMPVELDGTPSLRGANRR